MFESLCDECCSENIAHARGTERPTQCLTKYAKDFDTYSHDTYLPRAGRSRLESTGERKHSLLFLYALLSIASAGFG
jgi:hypothetical protein